MCIIVKTICKHVNIRVKSEKKVKVFYFQQTKTFDNNLKKNDDLIVT